MNKTISLLRTLKDVTQELNKYVDTCLVLETEKDEAELNAAEKDKDLSALDYLMDNFWSEMATDIQDELLHDDEYYKSIVNRLAQTVREHSFLLDIFAGDNQMELTDAMRDILEDFWEDLHQKSGMEMEEAYIRGHRDCFNYLIGMKMLGQH